MPPGAGAAAQTARMHVKANCSKTIYNTNYFTFVFAVVRSNEI